MDVPFFFSLHRNDDIVEQVLREAPRGELPQQPFYRVDLPDIKPEDVQRRELAVLERRIVFAMLHILAPPCDIDKVVPPDDRTVQNNEDSTLTFFQCKDRAELEPALWKEKLKHPESHRRFALLGPVNVPKVGAVELAVNFRREQQLFRTRIDPQQRLASLTEEGLAVVRAAFDLYLR
jgi:hypothetical protein